MFRTRARIAILSASLAFALGACLPGTGGGGGGGGSMSVCDTASDRVAAAFAQQGQPGAPSAETLAALIAAQTAACSGG